MATRFAKLVEMLYALRLGLARTNILAVLGKMKQFVTQTKLT